MEANFSVMTTIPICQDLELLMAPFLNSQLTLTHQLEWDCKCPYFQKEQFISCLKILDPSLIENQKVRAKIRCGFNVKGAGQLVACSAGVFWEGETLFVFTFVFVILL